MKYFYRQVNAGPQAYAAAFLGRDRESKWPSQQIFELKRVFREFIQTCDRAIYMNSRLIKEDQQEYHEDLEQKFNAMVHTISSLMGEKVSPSSSSA